MIVTCPNCSAKYRVRDDAVPHEGAQLKCPECAQLFLAHRPKTHDSQLVEAIERLTEANEAAETTVHDLKKQLGASQAEFEKAKTEFDRSNEQAGRALAQRDHEIADMRRELEKLRSENESMRQQTAQQTQHAQGQAALVSSRDQQVRALTQQNDQLNQQSQTLNQQIGQLRARAEQLDAQLELLRSAPPPLAASGGNTELRDQLSKAQTVAGRLTSELDTARRTIDKQNADLARLQQGGAAATPTNPLLEDEVARLREQLAAAQSAPPSAGADPQVMGLISAVAPMLWGLDQTVTYLEPFAASQPELGGHVRQLQLLAGMLHKLAETTGNKIN
jgi:predicted Zn finger-like uncharacterized protein